MRTSTILLTVLLSLFISNYSIAQEMPLVYEVENTGQKVGGVINETRSAGFHTVTFNASNLASGVYIYRLNAGGKVLTKKMILMK